MVLGKLPTLMSHRNSKVIFKRPRKFLQIINGDMLFKFYLCRDKNG